MKKIFYFLPVLLIFFVIIYFENKQYKEREKFYETEVRSKICKTNENWTTGRSKDYILEDGNLITLLSKEKLKIGDSISKEKDSWKFRIYTIKDNKYIFIKEYFYK